MRFLLTLSLIFIFGCTQKTPEIQPIYNNSASKIAMQRVVDAEPLARQDLVNRQAMQLALIEKMNNREEEIAKRFLESKQNQETAFLNSQNNSTKHF